MDSKIVLSWLSSHPRKWKTFVANRISEIMEVLPTKHWRHVHSKENPADIASRGIYPKCLPNCMLWWQGPPWLRLETSSWPKAESSCDEASDEDHRLVHPLLTLTISKTKTAEETTIRWVEGIYFQEEIQSIKKQVSLPPKSPLRSLHPFRDEHGLVRVGGRLQNSQIRFNSKHPVILPSQDTISELLINSVSQSVRLSKWVPHTLLEVHKQQRVAACFSLLSRHHSASIFDRVLTIDEKWVLYDTPKRSKHWLLPQDTVPHSARPPMHPRKLMRFVWWTCRQVVHYELLPTGHAVTADLYSLQLERVQKALHQKEPALVSRKGVLLLHDNARPHVVRVARNMIQ
ncbi:histone-lysine N-methyltransferase SETMAR [Trichonephila clavipes]|nr:histone-lysine N-methyltransferase SETMAR [Trichonephila clavipes]